MLKDRLPEKRQRRSAGRAETGHGKRHLTPQQPVGNKKGPLMRQVHLALPSD